MSTDASPTWEEKQDYGYTTISLISAVVGSIVIAFIFAFIYGPLEKWSPLAYLNVILTIGLGWAIGWGVDKMLVKYHIYRPGIAYLIALIAGVAGLWFAWIAYCWSLFGYNVTVIGELLLNPFDLGELIEWFANDPIWSLGKSSTGEGPWFYYAVWLMEAVILLGMPLLAVKSFFENHTYCPECRDWLEATGDVATYGLSGDDVPRIRSALAGGDLSFIDSLSKDAPEASWLEVTGYACPHCVELDSVATFSHVVLKEDKKGKPEKVATVLARFIPISVEVEKKLFESAPAADSSETAAGDSAGVPAGEAPAWSSDNPIADPSDNAGGSPVVTAGGTAMPADAAGAADYTTPPPLPDGEGDQTRDGFRL